MVIDIGSGPGQGFRARCWADFGREPRWIDLTKHRSQIVRVAKADGLGPVFGPLTASLRPKFAQNLPRKPVPGTEGST